ncbi:MAG TPA: hypothetical protein VFI91_08360 [Longimicrobiaceae bacterium]|nr:hypothetical protein [Longimicrobiaceae bacterium]
MKILQVAAVLLLAIAMAGGWAHLMELPNKMALGREDYLTVQQIYRGWALLGFVIFGALIAIVAIAVLRRGEGAPFYFAVVAAACIVISLLVFFSMTFPTNQVTQNWTVLPGNWEILRRKWEYSHATGAILYLIAMASLTLSIITGERRRNRILP